MAYILVSQGSELKLKSKCIVPVCIEVELDNEFRDLFADYLRTTVPDTPIKFEDEDTFNALRDTFIEKFVLGDEWTDYYDLTQTDISEYCYGAFAIDDNIIEQFVDFVCNCVLPEFTKTVAKYYKNRIQIARVD